MTVQSCRLQTPPQSLTNRLRCNNSHSCRDIGRLSSDTTLPQRRATPAHREPSFTWLHQTAMHFERQTQFGDIPWPQKGSPGTFLDPTQPVTDRVRVAKKHFSRTAHRRITVLPHPKRVEKHRPVL